MKGIKDSLKERIALLRLRQGDTEAFGFIYDTYVERLYRYVYFRISDKGLAYDIVQEVFLKTWEHIVQGKAVDNLQSFLYRIAYHKVVDQYRQRERQATLIDDLNENSMVEKPRELGEEIELHFLKKNINRLKPEYQDVLILRHVEGLRPAEIASILDKEVNAIRVTLHRALAALKALYDSKRH